MASRVSPDMYCPLATFSLTGLWPGRRESPGNKPIVIRLTFALLSTRMSRTSSIPPTDTLTFRCNYISRPTSHTACNPRILGIVSSSTSS